MALIKCTECGSTYDSSIVACPNCGCPTPTGGDGVFEKEVEAVDKTNQQPQVKQQRQPYQQNQPQQRQQYQQTQPYQSGQQYQQTQPYQQQYQPGQPYQQGQQYQQGQYAYQRPQNVKWKRDYGLHAEKTLTGIARLILILGIINCVTLFVGGIYWATQAKALEGLIVLATILVVAGVLVWTLLIWSLMRVMSNMSTSLKEINSKIKKEEK